MDMVATLQLLKPKKNQIHFLPEVFKACVKLSLKEPLTFVFKTVQLTEWLVVFVDVPKQIALQNPVSVVFYLPF